MKFPLALSYDDVLLVPEYSEIESRANIDTSVELVNGFKFSHPIIPANMKTVCGEQMAKVIALWGGLSFVHRFMSNEEQLDIAKRNVAWRDHIGYSVGVKESDRDMVDRFIEADVKILCLDIAHGDSKLAVDMVKYIDSKLRHTGLIVAGNISTNNGAQRLWDAGAHVVKVGVGPGSLCTTRVETGNGVPQLTAIMNVASSARGRHFIADGGIKAAGDCVKALCFADMVMAGNIFAGTTEASGEMLTIDGKSYKSYVGSSTHKANHIEGIAALVPAKGPVSVVLEKLLEGIKSGCSYQGSKNLKELKQSPQFVQITSAGLRESHPHDVIIK